MILASLLALLSLAIWLVLLCLRGGFWLARDRDDRRPAPPPARWPTVVAVVPARNEADVIARAIGSLLQQDYPGMFRVVLVDDGSEDGTAGAARQAASALGATTRLEVLAGAPLPRGWTGKLWAQQQGVLAASAGVPDYLLLTDADIGHAPGNLRALVSHAEHEKRVLVSLMARLTCTTAAERFLIPAFVFFFAMLYPFRWVAQAHRRTAAAAGGCMLVRRDALERAGGMSSIRAAIIDDCALGRRLKMQGPISLSLTGRASSLRPYGSIGEIGRMVSRSAYAQLGYSPLLLAATVGGMILTYLVPPALALFGEGLARAAGIAAWLLMALCFQPTLRFYGVSSLWGLALPAIGTTYLVFTLQSALQVWRGRGGMWKGRAQAMAGEV
jgi:hopene-associated glycosyltransferase HpnB